MPDTWTPEFSIRELHAVEIHSVGTSQSESQLIQQNLYLFKWYTGSKRITI